MDKFQKAERMAKYNLMKEIIAKRPSQNQLLEPYKTPHENPSLEDEPKNEEIKFHNEAHRKNYELSMKDRSEPKQKLDSKTMIEQTRNNSKD